MGKGKGIMSDNARSAAFANQQVGSEPSGDGNEGLSLHIELMSVQDITAATQLYQQCFAAAPWGESYAEPELVARYLSHYAQPLYDVWPLVRPLDLKVIKPVYVLDPETGEMVVDPNSMAAMAAAKAQMESTREIASAEAVGPLGSSSRSHNYSGLFPFFAWGAWVNDEMVALCCGSLKPWMEGMHACLDEFCVAPAYQGQGVGRVFLQGIELLLKERGINAVVTITDPQYQGKHFYHKCGYIPLVKQATLVKLLD